MAIKLIVAVDSDFGIGYKNELLFRVKEDLQRFRELTTGHFVVMGRKTYESLPKALPERINVVLTRNENYNPKNPSVIVSSDVSKIISHYTQTGEQEKDLWVIGGAEIYNQFLPYAHEVHLTMIHKYAENVDTYFPMDKVNDKFTMYKSERGYSEKYDCKLTFITYVDTSKVTL